MEMDMISQLPDDILISIITSISTKEAVRTSILSKKWRNLYKFVSTINISCPCLSPNSESSSDPCPFEVLNDRLCRFSQLHSGFIRCLVYRCHSPESYSHRFEECIYLLGKCMEKLVLMFDCFGFENVFPFSAGLLSHMPSLTYFKLKCCTLNPTLNSFCNSLKTLQLSRVRALPGSLECILSNCLNLSSLLIKDCDLPSKLCFSGPNLQLKCIMVFDYSKIEEIEIHAGNLITFEFCGGNLVNFIFDYVPQLQNINLCTPENTLSYCGILAKELPHLKSLLLGVQYDLHRYGIPRDFKTPVMINVFSHLKRLELCMCHVMRYNLFACTPLLRNCLFLEELHLATITVRHIAVDRSNVLELENQCFKHLHLKKVDISGFGGTQVQFDFILYIFKTAVRLDEMCLSWECIEYSRFGQWKVVSNRVIYGNYSQICFGYVQQLTHQAVSNTLQVIYQELPRVKSKRVIEKWVLVE